MSGNTRKDHSEYSDILNVLPQEQVSADALTPTDGSATTTEGYVYMGLLKLGREKRYKIGKQIKYLYSFQRT